MSATPIYTALRTATAANVVVTRGNTSTPLRHLLERSPDGFEWGFDGSGPSDLARSIVGDYLASDTPADEFTRAVLAQLIATAPAEGWTITVPQLHQAMRDAVHSDPLFSLGSICMTPQVSEQFRTGLDGLVFLERCLLRHQIGDWGHSTNTTTTPTPPRCAPVPGWCRATPSLLGSTPTLRLSPPFG